MTEQEWLACKDPVVMLKLLHGKTSERKLRLFAVACCRRIWHRIPDQDGKHLIEVAERHADGDLPSQVLPDLVRLTGEPSGNPAAAALACCMPVEPRCSCGAVLTLRHGRDRSFYGCSAYPTCRNTQPYWNGIVGAAIAAASATGASDPWPERYQQCRLIRDIVENPFRPPPVIDSSWLSWNGAIIPKLAQAIYDDRAFERLPILADALEEAGCTNADILNHCRQPGEHVRGCWVVDLLLGKS